MLRAMLAERFQLAAHIEDRDQPVYDLVVARADGKLGAGMLPTEIDCDAQLAVERAASQSSGTPTAGRETLDRNAPAPRCKLRIVMDLMEGDTTAANLATALRPFVGRVVVDKTGLSGFFRVTMRFDPRSGRAAPDPTGTSPDSPASIFTALREHLGLKLESSHAPAAKVVIDRVERPTPD
jgi:uncharacterized protein (TIGR03435 family)